jgi:hypothetical protein
MRYINSEMVLQDATCDLVFTLHDENLVNSVRYKSEPYINNRGQVRQLDFYIPKEVFNDTAMPDFVNIRISVDLD